MTNSRQIILVAVICAAVAPIAIANRQQTVQATSLQPKSDLKKLLPKHSALPPIAQLDQVSVESRGNQQKRFGRQRVSKGLYTHVVIRDPGMKEINGQAESIHLTIVDTVQVVTPGQVKDPPGLPISGATIVIGKIMAGGAYLNDEQTGVFSEYRVAVSDVLRCDSQNTIEVGDNISTWRPGGSVHFPSGHIEHFLVAGRGFPEVGEVYLFFLRPTDSGLSDYAISAAYSLKNQMVFPIDAAGDQSPFDGVSETIFLSTVRKEIAGASIGKARTSHR